MHGAQMVVFNMQSRGRSLWLMHGMFKANGGCGYVKKPDFLMNVGAQNEVFKLMAALPDKKRLMVIETDAETFTIYCTLSINECKPLNSTLNNTVKRIYGRWTAVGSNKPTSTSISPPDSTPRQDSNTQSQQ